MKPSDYAINLFSNGFGYSELTVVYNHLTFLVSRGVLEFNNDELPTMHRYGTDAVKGIVTMSLFYFLINRQSKQR